MFTDQFVHTLLDLLQIPMAVLGCISSCLGMGNATLPDMLSE